MRILSTTDFWFPDYVGGTARVARELALALASRGHEIVVIAPAAPSRPRTETTAGVTIERRIPHWSALPSTYTNALYFWRELKRLELGHFDVILAHHAPNAAAAVFASDIPVAYVFHASGLREAQFRRSTGISALAKARSLVVEPAQRCWESVAARRSAAVITLSEFSRRLVEADHPGIRDRTYLAGGAVDIDRYAPAADRGRRRAELRIAEEFLILTVRRLVPRMGVDLLLEAVALARTRLGPTRLVVVGDGELRQLLTRRAVELGVSDMVSFVGRVDDERLLAWYQAADVFALPSVAYEGFGMVTAEALACGLPVIGTDIGATPELLTPVAPHLLVPAGSSASLADALVAASRDDARDLRRRIRAHAVRSLSWESVVPQWEAALRAVATTEFATTG
jgi:glycosyltransferase involved in cell wall biosynthesis